MVQVDGMAMCDFLCNVCGAQARAPLVRIDREEPSCACGSTVRMRDIVYSLSLALFGRSLALPDFPNNPAITGFGLSDWDGYAAGLARKFSYQNTFYHQRPFLDIVAPPEEMLGTADFLISSDVFEHVPPPVSRAFDNAYRLLKPGGFLILTVPYSKEAVTIEHFPNLDRYRIIDIDGHHALVNLDREDRFHLHSGLIFHGGGGETLEMRVFCERGVLDALKQAGFTDIRIVGEDVPEVGIIHKVDWSLPIIARRPV